MDKRSKKAGWKKAAEPLCAVFPHLHRLSDRQPVTGCQRPTFYHDLNDDDHHSYHHNHEQEIQESFWNKFVSCKPERAAGDNIPLLGCTLHWDIGRWWHLGQPLHWKKVSVLGQWQTTFGNTKDESKTITFSFAFWPEENVAVCLFIKDFAEKPLTNAKSQEIPLPMNTDFQQEILKNHCSLKRVSCKPGSSWG